MLRLKVTPVVGLPQFTGWSQVAESTASVRVRLICVFAISGKHAGNVGRDINEKISDFYYYDVQQLHDFFKQIVEYVHSNECKIYFSCSVLNKSKSVFATYGGSVFLKRGEKSGKILESDFEVKIVEGTYQENDVFVLTTLQADEFLSEIQQKFLQGYDSDIIITSVVPGLHAQENSSLSALVFISKDDENKNQSEESSESFLETEIEERSVETNEITQNSNLKVNSNKNIIDQDSDENEQKDPKLPAAHFSSNLSENNKIVKPTNSTSKISLEIETEKQLDSQGNNVVKPDSKLVLIGKRLFPILKKVSTLSQEKLKLGIIFFTKLLLILFKKVVTWLKLLHPKNISKIVDKIKTQGVKSLFKQQVTYKIERTSKKNIFKFILVFIIVLVVVVAIGIVSYRRKNESERITTLLSPLNNEFIAAQNIAKNDPILAKEKLSELLITIESFESENTESSSINLVQELQNEVEALLSRVSGQEELTELDTFYDLRLIKPDFIASGIDIKDENLLLYDSGLKRLVFLNYQTKKITVRDFSEKNALIQAVLSGDQAFVLSEGIQRLELQEDSEIIEVRGSGDSNSSGILIDSYDRFVYVVNPEKRNIYRYAESDGEYSEPIGWMKSATGLKYDDIRSIAVDGDVWLTTEDGQLKQFTSGREEQFSIRGLDTPFSSDIYAYTHEDLTNLYVLDPTNSRVVILAKNGDFIREIKSITLGAASNLAVSEDLQTIFVIGGSIVYQIKI